MAEIVNAENQTAEHRDLHGPYHPSEYMTCPRCNYVRHSCPGCGEYLYHGTEVCGPCSREHGIKDRG